MSLKAWTVFFVMKIGQYSSFTGNSVVQSISRIMSGFSLPEFDFFCVMNIFKPQVCSKCIVEIDIFPSPVRNAYRPNCLLVHPNAIDRKVKTGYTKITLFMVFHRVSARVCFVNVMD